jgi:hypothetical protein
LEIALSESAGGAAAAALVRGFVILIITAFSTAGNLAKKCPHFAINFSGVYEKKDE